jgi:hypothetical protein
MPKYSGGKGRYLAQKREIERERKKHESIVFFSHNYGTEKKNRKSNTNKDE